MKTFVKISAFALSASMLGTVAYVQNHRSSHPAARDYHVVVSFGSKLN